MTFHDFFGVRRERSCWRYSNPCKRVTACARGLQKSSAESHHVRGCVQGGVPCAVQCGVHVHAHVPRDDYAGTDGAEATALRLWASTSRDQEFLHRRDHDWLLGEGNEYATSNQ